MRHRPTLRLTTIAMSGIALGLASCAVSTDMSKDAAFDDFVGKPLAMQEAAAMCRLEATIMRDDRMVNVKKGQFRRYEMKSAARYCEDRVATAMPGTSVSIEAVKSHFTPGFGCDWFALGSIEIDDTTYEFEFRMNTGYNRETHPMPWLPTDNQPSIELPECRTSRIF